MEEMELKQQKELIRQAKQHITESPPDYHLANYVLRDSPLVKKSKDLSDLSWGNASRWECFKERGSIFDRIN